MDFQYFLEFGIKCVKMMKILVFTLMHCYRQESK